MKSVYLNIYREYPCCVTDEMRKDDPWVRCVPASLRDQATILIRRTFNWKERSLLPLSPHIHSIINQIPSTIKPFLHFHFIEK